MVSHNILQKRYASKLMRVGVLQNTLGIGGRSKVVAESISVFSQFSTDINVHTLAKKREVRKFRTHYNIDPSVDIISHRGKYIPGTIYQQPLLNITSKKEVGDYDLVFNSNNCLCFLPSSPDFIHYIHFPLTATMTVDTKYDKLRYQIGSIPIKTLLKVGERETSGSIFVNSNYTQRFTQQAYPETDPEILYPPCIDALQFDGFNGEGIVSVGSFHPNKRQLLQLEIARENPDLEFVLIGSKESESYYNKCEEYISDKGIENARLLPNASSRKLNSILEKSKIFLHTMKEERFGIATVEGINHGCVPIVHNSGGQQEVVPWEQLRYTTKIGCEDVINTVQNGYTPPEEEVTSHLNKFTRERFKKRLIEEIYNIVNQRQW